MAQYSVKMKTFSVLIFHMCFELCITLYLGLKELFVNFNGNLLVIFDQYIVVLLFFLQCEVIQCKQVYDLDAAYMLKLYAYTYKGWDYHEMW